MSIMELLSSRSADRTQQGNRAAAALCLDNPRLLEEIADAFAQQDPALIGDCCEVLTMVAERQPGLILPYIDLLVPLLSHRTTRVRWESMHAIALAAEQIPEKLALLVPRMDQMLQADASTIVRDYTVDALGNLAKANKDAALLVFPILKRALNGWDGKHKGRALAGLCSAACSEPSLRAEVLQYAHDAEDNGKPAVRKAARQVIRMLTSRDHNG